jgi:hypothetical protein
VIGALHHVAATKVMKTVMEMVSADGNGNGNGGCNAYDTKTKELLQSFNGFRSVIKITHKIDFFL